MENATKALLIAAAVLIAILLISLGVGIFQKASEQMGSADLSEYEASKFNEKFSQYAGEKKTGAEVNALIETVFTHNNAQADTTTCVTLKNAGTEIISASNNLTEMPAKVGTGGRHVVKCSYSNGLINIIEIDPVSTPDPDPLP